VELRQYFCPNNQFKKCGGFNAGGVEPRNLASGWSQRTYRCGIAAPTRTNEQVNKTFTAPERENLVPLLVTWPTLPTTQRTSDYKISKNRGYLQCPLQIYTQTLIMNSDLGETQ